MVHGWRKSVTGMIKTSVHSIEAEDLGVATVEYLNGAIGVIEGSTAIQPGFKERIEIHGEKGSIILEEEISGNGRSKAATRPIMSMSKKSPMVLQALQPSPT